jgi:hypothetical protein
VVGPQSKGPYFGFHAKKSWWGPGRCPLCKVSEEDISHLLIHCPFVVSVWKEIESQTGLKIKWRGLHMEEILEACCDNPQFGPVKALPLIIC